MRITEIRDGSDVEEKVEESEEAGGSSRVEVPGHGGEVTGHGGEVAARGGFDIGRGEEEEEDEDEWEVVGVTGNFEAVGDGALPGGGSVGAGASGDDVTRRGSDEELGEWEEVAAPWDEAVGSTSGVAWDVVFPGGGGAGAAAGSGGHNLTGGVVEVEGRGGVEVTGRSRGRWLDIAKRTIIAGGARFLFYPTLARNVMLNKLQADFHWWDRVDQHIVLGAVPFITDVPKLMELGVRAVVTLTEPFETLIQTYDYQAQGIDHLAIPTPDYSAAPSIEDICRALRFMHSHALGGSSTYVHCKAGRGRSTTVVLCYLIRFKGMTPEVAWNHTRSIRPRISLTSAQHEAVTQFDNLNRAGGLPL